MSSLTDPPLLAVPNVSEGRDHTSIEAIAAAFTAASTERLLDVHHDRDHHRAVFTLSGRPGSLAQALVAGAAEAVRRVDIAAGGTDGHAAREGVGGYEVSEGDGGDGGEGNREAEGARRGKGGLAARKQEAQWGEDALPAEGARTAGATAQVQRRGEHPHVGAVDVVPIVYLHPAQRGAGCAEALVVADRIGVELGIPVFLYGELARGRTRAELRRGGVQGLAARMRAGELTPDFGPPVPHPTAGITLVCARGPLVAFNLELAPPATVEDARKIAALIREGGAEGLPGLRAIGVALRRGPAGDPRAEGGAMEARRRGDPGWPEGAGRVTAQVSMNVERPAEVPLRVVIDAVRAHAAVACAELVGLAPAAALVGFPADVPLPGFDPARHVLENALGL